mgnify:CR=1 FL=1
MNPLAVRKLKELKKAILADARVDWTETLVISDFIEKELPVLEFDRLAGMLEKAREDGVIEPDESNLVAGLLELLSARFEDLRGSLPASNA